ncbi:PaaI family thioesterase [Spirillospora sp. CA-255316]
MTVHNAVTMPSGRRVGGPERLFGVTVTADPAGDRRNGTMASGPWMRGPDSRPSSAALGVLIDDTLGIAASDRRPDGRSAVTTELSIDYVTPPPCDGQTITSRSEVISLHPRGALVTGRVEDGAGRTLAVMTLRSRYISAAPGIPREPETAPLEPSAEEPPHRESLLEMLNASIDSDDRQVRLTVPGDGDLANGSGVMHGGITLCASQLAASQWLPAEEGVILSSARITYLRRLELDGDIEFLARIVHGGRSFRLVDVTAHGPTGEICATATIAGYSMTTPRTPLA